MNFIPALAAMAVSGEKTVTRRVANDNPRSPWYRGRCGIAVGHNYAVCPGRGKHAVGRIRIKSVRLQPLGRLYDVEARREGICDAATFEQLWAAINGRYDPDVLVWRVEFEPHKEGDA